jgi:hypothetical protein
MKFKFILAALTLLSFRAFSQSKNNVSLIFGVANATVATTGTIPSATAEFYTYTYRITSGLRYGATYTRDLTKWLSVETDVLYVQDKAHILGDLNGTQAVYDKPVNFLMGFAVAKVRFLKYLFIDFGVGIDEQTSSNYGMMYDQSGFSAEAGFGAKFNIHRISLSINPFVHTRSVLAIWKTDSNNEMTEQGIKFGVGYNF